MPTYFFDSYAIIEIVKDNPNYKKYAEEIVVISIFNLAEIYWSALNDLRDDKAKEIYRKFRECVVEIDDDTIMEAIKFRKEHKKKDLSYTDCIGYTYALKNNLLFLTGDKEFESMKNVEFVKK